MHKIFTYFQIFFYIMSSSYINFFPLSCPYFPFLAFCLFFSFFVTVATFLFLCFSSFFCFPVCLMSVSIFLSIYRCFMDSLSFFSLFFQIVVVQIDVSCPSSNIYSHEPALIMLVKTEKKHLKTVHGSRVMNTQIDKYRNRQQTNTQID